MARMKHLAFPDKEPSHDPQMVIHEMQIKGKFSSMGMQGACTCGWVSKKVYFNYFAAKEAAEVHVEKERKKCQA